MFCARAAGHDGGQCDPAHYCAAERSADAIVDCHRSWSPRPADPRLRQHTDALLQPYHTCDFHDDGRNRFAACKQIVALLISRHNARFVHDLLRNLGSCRRTVATFTRTRRGFLSFLVRSRAEEDGRHSRFGVLAATIPLFIVDRQALNSAVMRLSCCTAAGYRTIAGAICRYLPVVRLVCCTAAGYHAGENVDRLQPVPHRIFHPPCQLWLVATKTAPSARHRCGYRYCRKA